MPEDGDCDDDDPKRSPGLSDVCGDGIDNDCDGITDDESNNACGGPCTTQLVHQPDEACDNGLLGACRRLGKYECNDAHRTVCNAGPGQSSGEVCDDGIDNDCDGSVDEADAVDTRTWFQDCDKDGFAASTLSSLTACKAPAVTPTCDGWTMLVPAGASTVDCDDTSAAYHPDATYSFRPSGKTSFDLDCDGVVESEMVLRDTDPTSHLPVNKICAPNACDDCLRETVINYPIVCTTGQNGTDFSKGESNWVIHMQRGADGECQAGLEYYAYLYCK